MRSSAIVLGLALLSPLAFAGAASAQTTPSDVRDLVGARGSSGENALTTRGYVNVGSEAGDDRRWTYWWNERRGVCLSVATVNGRYDSIVSTPSPDCRRSRPTTLPGPVGGPVHDGRPTTLPGPVGGPVASGRTETIRFARGASSARRQGAVSGYETMTYLIDLRAGQSLNVAMRTSNRASYFNVTAPGANEALFIGSTSGNRYQGRTTASGTYKVEVYLMRSAARRGERANYTLDISAGR